MFRGIVEFIKSKAFVINLAIFIVLFSAISWGVFKWLNTYTKHGKTVAVPNFIGVRLSNLDAFVNDKQVKYTIIDSLYDPKSPKGVVVKQEPEANELVKENRTIYLYVTSLHPPQIIMPKLIDRSLRQATAMLASYGLKLGYKTGECASCILEQLVKGKAIEPGKPISKGTVVDLIVGKSLQEEVVVTVPCLLGLTRKEAQEKLQEVYLKLGTITYESNKDSLKSKVFEQTPPCEDINVGVGTMIDIFLTTNKSKLSKIELNKKKQDEDFE